MRLRYTSDFKGFKGINHEIKIWDNVMSAGGTPVEVILESPGYTIDYDAGITNIVKGGIIQSGASIFIKNTNGAVDALLTSLLITENRYLLEILRDGTTFWYGIILQDFGSTQDLPDGVVEIAAVDGIGLLEKVDVECLDYPNISSFLQYLIAGLGNIATAELYEVTDTFLKVKTDWYNDSMQALKEPLDVSAVNDIKTDFFWSEEKSRTGYNGSIVDETVINNYKYLIDVVLRGFNAVLIMSDGVWTIYQRELMESNTIEFKGFQKDGTYKADFAPLTTYKEILATNNMYRAKGEFSNIPGINQIKIIYLANMVNRFNVSSLIPFHFQPGDSYTTFQLLTGVGGKENYLHISLCFSDMFSVLLSQKTFFYQSIIRAVYTLEVKIGAYYLQADGQLWHTTPETISIWSHPMRQLNPNATVISGHNHPSWDSRWVALTEASFKTDNLPIDGEVEISLVYVGLVYRQLPSSTFNTYSSVDTRRVDEVSVTPANHYVLYIWDNDKPIADVTYIAKNTNTVYTLNEQLDDTLFGSAGVTSRGDIFIYDGANWNGSFTLASKHWNKGSASVKDQYFNGLLANEILSNQQRALLTYSGTIIDRNTSNLFSPVQVIQMDYKSATYRFAINKTTYSAFQEQWDGDWFQIGRTQIRNVTSSKNDLIDLAGMVSNNMQIRQLTASGAMSDVAQFINLRTGEMTSADSPMSMTQIQFKDKTTLLPLPNAPTGYTMLTKKGTDLLIQSSNGAVKSLLKDVQIKYGFLYNQDAVLDPTISSSATWKVPRLSDITTLVTALGVAATDAGALLKEKGTLHWTTPNTKATDLVGFMGLGSGIIDTDGWDELNEIAYFWANAGGDYYTLSYNSAALGSNSGYDGVAGMAVRLMRDLTAPEIAAGNADGFQYDDYVGNDGQHYPVIQIGTQAWITENLVETKLRDGTAIPEYLSGFFAAGIAARCSYNYDETYAFEINKLKEVNIDAEVLSGDGSRAHPSKFLDKDDGLEYIVNNGKFALRKIFYAAVIQDTLDSESWSSLLTQNISATGVTSTSIIQAKATGTRAGIRIYFNAEISAVPITDNIEFEAVAAPEENIDVEIIIFKY